MLDSLSRSQRWLLDLAGHLTIGAVAVVSLLTISDPGARWLAVILLVVLSVLRHVYRAGGPPLLSHLFMLVQTGLVVGFMFLRPMVLIPGVLFFVLSAQAMLCLSVRPAILWISLFTLITGIGMVAELGWTGFVVLLPYAGGFFFFGAFGNALRTADEARQQSQHLLDELRSAQSRLQEFAVVEERNRLARELHDALGHRLTVAVVQLEGAQRLIPSDPNRAARMIGAMRDQLKEALGDLRRTVVALRTPAEAELPLAQALTHLAHTFQESTGVAVHLTLPQALRELPESHPLALYRAAQESLTNVQRHARAHQVWLTLSLEEGMITLTAIDDGLGFPDEVLTRGVGLSSLRERAAQLGGELRLSERPSGGASLQFVLPWLEAVHA